MSRVVTGAYRERAEAEEALAGLARQVAVLGHATLGRGDDLAALDGLGLGGDARAGLAAQIESGTVLLLARVADEATAERAIDVLGALAAQRAATAPPAVRDPIAAAGEELRIGEPAVARGGARVSSRVAGAPAREEASLRDEGAAVERRAVGRRLTEEEVASGGLLRERVFEISEMREVPVIEKQAFVREELVVRKSVAERVQEVEETVRRTEVEVEELAPGGPAADRSRRTL